MGAGLVEPVPPAVWACQVGGKPVLVQWFNARRRDREKPSIGDRRPPSPLGDIQPDHWLAGDATDLLNLLNVLGLMMELEPQADALLARICAGPQLTEAELQAAGAFFPPGRSRAVGSVAAAAA